MRLVVLTTVILTACGSYPCQWDTTTFDRNTETPGMSLECGGNESRPVGAFYTNSVSPAAGRESLLSIRMLSHPESPTVNFAANVPDGSHMIDGRVVWVDPPATGSFKFSRSRDVPIADIEDPEERVYQTTIDFELDLSFEMSRCTLRTQGPVRLVQAGPVKMCARGRIGGAH